MSSLIAGSHSTPSLAAALPQAHFIRLGTGSCFAEDCLHGARLRFTWDHVPLSVLKQRDWIEARRRIEQANPGAETETISNDLRQLTEIVEAGPDEIWITFYDGCLWWARLAPGGVEEDGTSRLRRTAGHWSNRSSHGVPLLEEHLPHELLATGRYKATACSADSSQVAAAIDLAASPSGFDVDPAQSAECDELRLAWDRLKLKLAGDHSGLRVRPLGHGLSLERSKGPEAWRASLYWRACSPPASVEFCISPRRLAATSGEAQRFDAWLQAQRRMRSASPARARKAAFELETAQRFGLSLTEAVSFLSAWREQLDPGRFTRAQRWGFIPSESAVAPAVLASTAGLPEPAIEGVRPEEPPALWRASIADMVENARKAEAASGREHVATAKTKMIGFPSDQDLARHIALLIENQGGQCALTRLPLLPKGAEQPGQEDFLASLDRKRSDGHYEATNLQVVCRFANRWKGASSDQHFLDLLSAVRKVSAVTS